MAPLELHTTRKGEIYVWTDLKPCFSLEIKPAADDLFGEADDISSDSDAEKPPTPGQPLVSVTSSQMWFIMRLLA